MSRLIAALAFAAAIAANFCAHAQQTGARQALEQLLEEGDANALGRATLADRERISTLYQGVNYRLLWSDGTAPTAAALSLLQEMRQASARGLDPLDYPGNQLAYLLIDLIDSPNPGIEQWAAFDAAMSLAGVHFLSDVHFGRVDPASVGHNLTTARIPLDIPATLIRLASAPDVAVAVDALEPQFKHYVLLKQQLAAYRLLADREGLSDLPALPGKAVKPGEEYAGAAKLAALLQALGDAPPVSAAAPAMPASLTPSLVDALKHFQHRHGERPDGVLGAATYQELTRPLQSRVRQIELTMERWRWLPAELVSAPIIVNIPQFRLFAFESTSDSEARIRQMDVIVGKAFDATQTPVFTADMSYLIFRPYWEVPYSIALKEIVPSARSNPASIAKKQLQIVRGNGDGAEIMPNTPANIELVAQGALRLRQLPGPNNSLGLVKFMLPNPYNVYLHSTPAQALFAETRRDFSHGCIRVSDPVALAQYVLRDSPDWSREKIMAAMNGNAPQTVSLKNKIRVFIVYGTVLVTESGEVQFFDDIYGHDRRLDQALSSRQSGGIAART